MRYAGRVKVNKVDYLGNSIKGKLSVWIKKNPNKLYFDSKVEWACWKELKESKVKFIYQPTLLLFNGIKTLEFKKGKIKEYSQRSISYSPDFYLPTYKTYIEVKGYADPLFKLRWKLFKLEGYTGFIVYSVPELKQLLKELRKRGDV